MEVYWEEEFPTPAYQLHFGLFELSNFPTVAVDVVKKRMLSGIKRCDECGSGRHEMFLKASCRFTNAEGPFDGGCMARHVKNGMVPRIIAETKYADVAPLFQTNSKRTHKRKTDDGEGSGNEEEVKKDENEEDADEDEDDNN